MSTNSDSNKKLDAVGNLIPEDIECPHQCTEYDTPHTHVRGSWNRPGYHKGLVCSKESCSKNHTIHFHKV